MEPAFFLEQLQLEGTRLGQAARLAPESTVPSCPEWDLTALLRHVGQAHRWFAELVRTRASEAVWTTADSPTDPLSLADWYDEGLQDLAGQLSTVDPDTPVWNWLDNRPAPARFWQRRAAHETAVHRWDAEHAVGTDRPLETSLAVDGIDEYLAIAAFMLPIKPVPALSGSLRLAAADTGQRWRVVLEPARLVAQQDDEAPTDAAVEGSASNVLLWLVNRLLPGTAALQVSGDEAIIQAWRSTTF